MSHGSTVGALALPLEPGAQLSPLVDPVVDGLLDFLAFSLREALNPKLARLSPTSADACPPANRHAYEPRTHWVRNAKPALYLWWGGKSSVGAYSTVYDTRERELSLFYVWEEVVAPSGQDARAGLMAAADAALARASSLRMHPDYGYRGAPPGTPLAASLARLGLVGWAYRGGQVGIMSPSPGDLRNASAEGAIVRFFPALQATVAVSEKILGYEDTAAPVVDPWPVTLGVHPGPEDADPALPEPLDVLAGALRFDAE